MDPVTIAAVTTAAATVVGAVGSASAMRAEAAAGQRKAEIESQWAERRAKEERATAQRAAGEEQRKARLAQGRLTTLAGASGAGVDDPTVMDLFGDIAKEGDYNAGMALAAGEQKAAGLTYQADLGTWAADANAKIKRGAATTTLISGLLGAAGSGMGVKYGGTGTGSGSGGYGRYG